eukprot:7565328-Heterocapsa_arctica.AAC.1
MSENMIGVPWDARSEAPRGRRPKPSRAPTEVMAQPAPERPEGQDPGVQSDVATVAAGEDVSAQKGAAAGTAADSAVHHR